MQKMRNREKERDKNRNIPQYHLIDLPGILGPGTLETILEELILKIASWKNRRNQISDLHFDKFLDTSDFQCWKTNFKTEVCSCSGCPTIAMLWIKEVEVAKSVDDIWRRRKIEVREFPDF